MIKLPVASKYNLTLDMDILRQIDTSFVYTPMESIDPWITIRTDPGTDLSEKY